MKEIEALDSCQQGGSEVPLTSQCHNQSQESRCEITVSFNESTTDDDDDVSSIGSVEDEDEFFLFTPNSRKLDQSENGNSHLTPSTIIENLTSFSLTPRKTYDEPLLCMPECSSSLLSAAYFRPTVHSLQRK
jgi:hypothetical protein